MHDSQRMDCMEVFRSLISVCSSDESLSCACHHKPDSNYEKYTSALVIHLTYMLMKAYTCMVRWHYTFVSVSSE